MTALQTAPAKGLKMTHLDRSRNERGITTAEYAVGTVAAVSIVGVLLKIITSEAFAQIIMTIIKWIVGIITKMA
jgi:hypothetical protein